MESLGVLENKPDIKKERDLMSEGYLTFFRRLKDDYSNDIPKDIIHSTDENNRLKIRKAWFTVLVNQLQMFEEDYLADPVGAELMPLASDVANFVANYTSKDFQHLERVGSEDVEAGDAILDKVISYLENL